MASFTVRIELHGAHPSDYDQLHREMEQRGFHRFVTGATSDGATGTWLLPTAEYDFESEAAPATVRDMAKQVADGVRAGAWVLVTKVAARSWSTKKIR